MVPSCGGPTGSGRRQHGSTATRTPPARPRCAPDHLAGAAAYAREAARLAREAENAADAWRRSLDRIRELLAAARTAEAVAGAPEDADDDPRAHHGIARAFRREAAQLRRSLLNPAKSGP